MNGKHVCTTSSGEAIHGKGSKDEFDPHHKKKDMTTKKLLTYKNWLYYYQIGILAQLRVKYKLGVHYISQ